MNLQDAVELQKLPVQRPKTSLKAMEVAKRVFELSARYGEPYENQTPETWKKDWLASDRFVLAEVGTEQVGIPYAKKINPEKVRRSIAASADGQMEPIVVDLNRQQIGRTPLGYVPKVIVVDGKHRHRAQVEMGKDRVLAWVGERAMSELRNRQNGGKRFVMEAASSETYEQIRPMSNLLATATLYSAIAVKPSSAMTRQDTGDGGSRPTGGTQTQKWEAMGSGPGGGGMGGSLGGGSGSNPAMMRVTSSRTPEARSSGSLEDADPSDKDVVTPDPSDAKTFVDPSDRQNWNPDKPQLCAPGCEKNHEHNFGGSPSDESPGSGVGPRLKPDWGATKSEFNKGGLQANRNVEAGPIKVKKITTKKKSRLDKLKERRPDLEAVAPPGRERQIKTLKRKFGEDSAMPFKIAWNSYNKK